MDLSGNLDGARVDSDHYDKESAKDFVLWKGWKEGEPSWESPWGRGRPGWHLECSAMSAKYLGEVFDLHTGGVDLVFPHHENEIAQSRGATGKAPARHWMHVEHLLVNGEKMSKSLGNFYTLRDLLEKGVDPMALRYLLLSVSYRKQFNFTFEALDGAKAALGRIRDFAARLQDGRARGVEPNPAPGGGARGTGQTFREALEDDLNTAVALSALFEARPRCERRHGRGRPLRPGPRETMAGLLDDFEEVFGIPLRVETSLEAEVEALIAEAPGSPEGQGLQGGGPHPGRPQGPGHPPGGYPQGVRWKKS